MKRNSQIMKRRSGFNEGSSFGNVFDYMNGFDQFPALWTTPWFNFAVPAFPGPEKGFTEDVKVREEHGRYVVKAGMPGLKQEDIRVKVHKDVMHISGERKEKKDERNPKKDYRYSSESYRHFEARVRLPGISGHEKTTSHYRNGELTVEVQKAHERKMLKAA